ncbi:hypothetical protein, partial [Streptomyces sp. NPDC005568]|uniref:hypothetical protein n=1 Tax=Streptomyces sp. NPDC005568 TaxID=3156887 RepID=UPI0033AB0BDA
APDRNLALELVRVTEATAGRSRKETPRQRGVCPGAAFTYCAGRVKRPAEPESTTRRRPPRQRST